MGNKRQPFLKGVTAIHATEKRILSQAALSPEHRMWRKFCNGASSALWQKKVEKIK